MCKNIFKIKNICFYQIIKISTHLLVVGPDLTSRSWLDRRLVVVRHCRSPLLTPVTNPIHGSLWMNCVHQHTLTQVHSFLKSLLLCIFLSLRDSSANIISFVALDLRLQRLEQMWLWCGLYCIWLRGKTHFIGLQGRCLFLLVGELREESSLLLSSFSFFILILFFLIYNNFLRLNYWLHV